MADVVVGIDVSKNKLDVNLCGGGREKVKAFDNSSAGWRHLDSWLRDQKLRCALICLEATGRYSLGVALALHEAGYVVSIVNPAQIRDFARSKLGRNKTDDIDAALIREYGEKFSPRPWTPPTPAMRRLRELQTVRAGIVASLTEWKNRDGSGLEDQAARVLTGETVRHLATQLEAVDKVIAETIEGDNELRAKRDLLLTINGVGEILASIVLAELPGAGDLALGLRGCRLCRAEPRTTPFRKLHKPANADLGHWGCGIASGTLYASVDRDAVQSSGQGFGHET